MRILQVYNQYRSPFNGEEAVVQRTVALLRAQGHEVDLHLRSSRELSDSWADRWRAFTSGIYSRTSYREMTQCLQRQRPDLVHVHNVYPLLSPSVLVACRQAGVPVVMSVHNQMFTCPKADHLRQGRLCERCTGGHEYQCAVRNCRGNWAESLAYALRSTAARRLNLFRTNVTLFVALSEFARQRLMLAGIPPERVAVVPNMARRAVQPGDAAAGQYVGFAGRLSPEKGLATLLAAGRLAGIPIRVAGTGPLAATLQAESAPPVRWLGQLSSTQMTEFYHACRFLVLPSVSYEMCPLVILEAMAHGRPVITTALGGQAELVKPELTGLLCRPLDVQDLAEKMQRLWHDPAACRRMGQAAYAQACAEYDEPCYYPRLLAAYQQALALSCAPGAGGESPASAVVPCEEAP